jgi:arylsulfatase A-like enzyme
LSAFSKSFAKPRRLRRTAIRGSLACASWLVLLAFSLVLGASCSENMPAKEEAPAAERADAGAAPTAPRLVVVYATCSLNKSYLSPYRADVDYTPNLARFAERALTFERHHTEAGQSGTAYASLFTGSQADHHHVFFHPRHLRDEVDSLTEVFARGGFEVHTWLAHLMATASLGFAQGVPEANRHKSMLTGVDPEFRKVLERLQADPKAKALVVTTFTVTHGPYVGYDLPSFCALHPARCGPRKDEATFRTTSKRYRKADRALSFDYENEATRLGLDDEGRRRMSAVVELLYRSSVAGLDTLFGEVLEAIAEAGLEDQALVVFTSDHGESLDRPGEPFKWTHGFQLSLDELEVALLMSGPGVSQGRYPGVTRSIDVLPTIAAMSGLPAPVLHAGAPPSDTIGRDLSAAVRGDELPPDLTALVHTGIISPAYWPRFEGFETLTRYFPEPSPAVMWLGLRRGDSFFQLRRLPGKPFKPALFDLRHDPLQQKNLFDPANPEHLAAATALKDYRHSLIAKFDESRFGATPPDAEKRLRALGYIE